MAYRRLTDLYIDIVEGKTDEASIDLLRKKLRKVKGITKDQIAVLSTMPTPVLTSVINQLSLIVSQKEEVEEVNERLGFHKKSPAELKGSEFNRKLEMNNCKKLLKMIEQSDKFHSKFQYNNRAAFGPNKIGEGLRKTEDAIYDYMNSIEKGKWDGKVTLED